MPRRGRRKRAGPDKETLRKKVAEGIKVRAEKASSGRPATAVHVDVELERVKRQVGDFPDVEEVVAKIPSQAGERDVRWEEQRLDRLGEQARPPGGPAPPPGEQVVRYSGVHYGPSDVDRYGVDVRVRTAAGDVEPPERGGVREADKPRDPRKVPPAKR